MYHALLRPEIIGADQTYAATNSPDMPFGGYKGSGQGREGYAYSVEEHLEIKSILIKLEDNAEVMPLPV